MARFGALIPILLITNLCLCNARRLDTDVPEDDLGQFIDGKDRSSSDQRHPTRGSNTGLTGHGRVPPTRNTQPRFIGNLKKKLCKLGIGMGCGHHQTFHEIGYPIEPQNINYVQPLVIKPIGKPIPAIPAKGPTQMGQYAIVEPVGIEYPSGVVPFKSGSPHSHLQGISYGGHSSGGGIAAGHILGNTYSRLETPAPHYSSGVGGSSGVHYKSSFQNDAPVHSSEGVYAEGFSEENYPIEVSIVHDDSDEPVYIPEPYGPPRPSDILPPSGQKSNFDLIHGPGHIHAKKFGTAYTEEVDSKFSADETGPHIVKHIHVHKHIHQIEDGIPHELVSSTMNKFDSAPSQSTIDLKKESRVISNSPQSINQMKSLNHRGLKTTTVTTTCICVPRNSCPKNKIVFLPDNNVHPRNVQKTKPKIPGPKEVGTFRRPKPGSVIKNIKTTKKIERRGPIKTHPKIILAPSRIKREASSLGAQKHSAINRRSIVAQQRLVNEGSLPFSCGLHEVCCEARGSEVTAPQPSLHSHSTTQDNRRCGRSMRDGIHARMGHHQPLIKEDTIFGEFPWQAAFLKKDGLENVYICAGAVIDSSHVMTAAHCVDGYAVADLRVRLGEWDVNRESEFYPHVEYDVVGIATHPDYSAGNLHNDIALVRLLYPIDFSKSPHVSPICLPERKGNDFNHRCYVTGWGKDAFGHKGRYQNLMQKVDVPLMRKSSCESNLRTTRLGPEFELHPGMTCAGGEPDRDACKGDGGGPLSCIGSDGRYYAAGIVSWGVGCGQPGIPGIYTNVEYYIGWIRDMVKM